MESNIQCTNAPPGRQAEKEPEGKTSLFPSVLPTEAPHCFSIVLWAPFELVGLAQACPYLSPSASLPVCPSCPQVLDSPMCHPAPLHMLFPLSRMPFHLFIWPDLCQTSVQSQPGIMFSQQPVLLPGWARVPVGLPQPSNVFQVLAVLAFVHSHLPDPRCLPLLTMSSQHLSPPTSCSAPFCCPQIPLNPCPPASLPHSCVPSFSAESELEKEQWLEAMQGAIAEALSTSEVAERIWAVAPNRFCADCGAAQPDWASINLCVVICKRCAGLCGGWGGGGIWAKA